MAPVDLSFICAWTSKSANDKGSRWFSLALVRSTLRRGRIRPRFTLITDLVQNSCWNRTISFRNCVGTKRSRAKGASEQNELVQKERRNKTNSCKTSVGTKRSRAKLALDFRGMPADSFSKNRRSTSSFEVIKVISLTYSSNVRVADLNLAISVPLLVV